MVLFNRFSLAPLALSGTGTGSLLRAAEEVAQQFAGQLGGALAPAASAGYGELTRATATATEEGVTLEVIAPGFGPDDIELTVKRDEVSVEGARGATDEGGARHRFSRTWRLGFPIDTERTSAKVEHGVLTIELARHASEQPRSIAIDGAQGGESDSAVENSDGE